MKRPGHPYPAGVQLARDQWVWRGQKRPPFAAEPGPGQCSVWDFPRPPKLAPESREITIVWDGLVVARTARATKVLETGHPPTYYIPWVDIASGCLQPASGGSFCEWKGPARYWSLVHGSRRLPAHAWSYPEPLAGAEALRGSVAFYAQGLACTVGGLEVTPQPGGFYGGWVTPDLAGPFKGAAGSEGW